MPATLSFKYRLFRKTIIQNKVEAVSVVARCSGDIVRCNEMATDREQVTERANKKHKTDDSAHDAVSFSNVFLHVALVDKCRV